MRPSAVAVVMPMSSVSMSTQVASSGLNRGPPTGKLEFCVGATAATTGRFAQLPVGGWVKVRVHTTSSVRSRWRWPFSTSDVGGPGKGWVFSRSHAIRRQQDDGHREVRALTEGKHRFSRS